MRAFCDIYAPGLFDMIEKCLFCDYSVEQIESKNELRQQRVVGELYRLAYQPGKNYRDYSRIQ